MKWTKIAPGDYWPVRLHPHGGFYLWESRRMTGGVILQGDQGLSPRRVGRFLVSKEGGEGKEIVLEGALWTRSFKHEGGEWFLGDSVRPFRSVAWDAARLAWRTTWVACRGLLAGFAIYGLLCWMRK
jgi:hypothetical protein